MRARFVLVCLALVLAGCSSSDDDAAPPDRSSTTSSTSTTEAPTTTTTAFEGGAERITAPSGTDRTVYLTDVTVEHEPGVDRVTFELRDVGVPAVVAEYVEQAIADGSGDVVEVEGAAKLQIRMEPAASADLSGEELERTYAGPDRVTGDTTAVTEVVRTGDFEAVLTWVIGVGSKAPFRISTLFNPSRVVVEVAAP